MCTVAAALTLGAIGTVTATGGTVMGVVSENRAAKYNAKVAELQAKDALERGHMAESEHRRKVALLTGKQRASAGASGTVVDIGSNFDVISDTQFFGGMDALTLRHNATKEAWGYRAQNFPTSSPLLAGASTLLVGAGQFTKNYVDFKTSGALS